MMSNEKKGMNVVDLFCGAGGLSQGFKEAGFDILLANDFDENSSKTYKSNHKEVEFLKEDIHKLNLETILNFCSVKKEEVDIVVGGPPCQGFSIAGNRNEDDRRNELFKEFTRLVESLKPNLFLMENVPGLLSMDTPDGEPVVDVIAKSFDNIGYNSMYKTLNSADFFTPQKRKRVFFIGSKKEVNLSLPSYSLYSDGIYLTVADAISDLPSLEAGESSDSYKSEYKNWYQRYLRRNEPEKLKNHSAVNHKNRIVERYSHIPQGGDMSDAPKKLQPNKYYSSRNRRLEEGKPSYTVTSHVLDELIHPWDNRGITVREAARLQGFPDHYYFKGKRNVFHSSEETSQYEQVGNAVPVPLAKAIAIHIKSMFKYGISS